MTTSTESSAAFSADRIGFPIGNYLSNDLCAPKKTVTRESYRGEGDGGSMASNTFWCVGRYVIMPGHIHLFCTPNTFPAQSLKKWIACWKNQVTREWTNRLQIPIWQREFWDRQLRRAESYEEKWNCMRNNPVRHGYVSRVEDWPYQDELNAFEWHDR